jgi:phosphoserine phosphatase
MILLTIDFDGVIVDTKKKSKQIFYRVLKKLLKKGNINYKIMYGKCDGLSVEEMSKTLNAAYNINKTEFIKLFINEWELVYNKIIIPKKTIEFFDFIKKTDVKPVILSSAPFYFVNKIFKKISSDKRIAYIKKETDKNLKFKVKFKKKLKILSKKFSKSIHIDDNIKFNKEIKKINYDTILFNIKKNDLKNVLLKYFFNKKINFFYECKNILLKNKQLRLSRDKRIKCLNKFKILQKKNTNIFDGNLAYANKVNFINNKVILYGCTDRFHLKHGSKILSVAIQGITKDFSNNYYIGKRKNFNEYKKLEFLPSGSLDLFKTQEVKNQFLIEATEEIYEKIRYLKMSIKGIFFDFRKNMIDICILGVTNKIDHKIINKRKSEHFYIKKFNIKTVKKNKNYFTNSSSAVIQNIL